ncbi:DNA-binding protein [Clostridium sp. 19966]|uniref:DNA-binding protein n=1 Tax=Clostridium sp. 19966 TaxID=2768166 RepID=UPI0028E26E5D|nr:DNA-binding protein [Clostridium sp. 19966]
MEYSSKRETTLCREGRVDGAIAKGSIWLIPDNAPKPIEKKLGRKLDRRVKDNA